MLYNKFFPKKPCFSLTTLTDCFSGMKNTKLRKIRTKMTESKVAKMKIRQNLHPDRVTVTASNLHPKTKSISLHPLVIL